MPQHYIPGRFLPDITRSPCSRSIGQTTRRSTMYVSATRTAANRPNRSRQVGGRRVFPRLEFAISRRLSQHCCCFFVVHISRTMRATNQYVFMWRYIRSVLRAAVAIRNVVSLHTTGAASWGKEARESVPVNERGKASIKPQCQLAAHAR